MGRLLLALFAVLGGLAFWRLKTLKDDAATVSEAARSGVARVKGGSSDSAEEDAGSEESAASVVGEAASDIADAVEEAEDSTDS